MDAIARAGRSASTTTGMPARAAPNLEAQVRTFRAQLADWVTCPSAKTPEGKAKIEQITAKLDSVKDQIKNQGKKRDLAEPTATAGPAKAPAPPAPPAPAARTAVGSVETLPASGALGSRVDTYA